MTTIDTQEIAMLVDVLKEVQVLLDKMIQMDRLNFHHSSEYLGEAGIDYVRDVLSLQGKIDYLLGEKK
jgi:hypothetical protein